MLWNRHTATSPDTSHELVVMICIFVRQKLVEARYMHQETNNTKTMHSSWVIFIRASHTVYGYELGGTKLVQIDRAGCIEVCNKTSPVQHYTTNETCQIQSQLIYISRIQCTTRHGENWRSWTWPMKNHISQALGGNGRNGYKQELRNSDNQEHCTITTSWNKRKSDIQSVPEGIIFRHGHLASSLTMNTGINFRLLLLAGTYRCFSSVE
jgi:hypothetical protein